MKMQLYVVADTGTEVISEDVHWVGWDLAAPNQVDKTAYFTIASANMNVEVDFKITDPREFYKLVMKLRRLKRRAIYLRKYRRRGERMSRHG